MRERGSNIRRRLSGVRIIGLGLLIAGAVVAGGADSMQETSLTVGGGLAIVGALILWAGYKRRRGI
jgi:drug/metabolite transporter (DMT)-like permease